MTEFCDNISVELSDIENIPDPLLNVKAGLVSSSDAPVPLTAVHVKARLIDLAAQVSPTVYDLNALFLCIGVCPYI